MKAAETRSTAGTAGKNSHFFSKDSGQNFFGSTGHEVTSFFQPAGPSSIQAKLSTGQPQDKYEKEADTIADKVIQPREMQTSTVTSDSCVQLKCAECEKEEKMQKEETGEEEIQTKPIFESNQTPPEEDTIQPKCAECEQEEKAEKKQTGEEEIQAKSIFESNEPASLEEDAIQTKCAACEEEKVQKKEENENGKENESGDIGVINGNEAEINADVIKAETTTERTTVQQKSQVGKKVSGHLIQAKLRVGHPGDQYETEADAVADKTVERISDQSNGQSADAVSNSFTGVQSKCSSCEAEEKQKEKEEEPVTESQVEIHKVADLDAPPEAPPADDAGNNNNNNAANGQSIPSNDPANVQRSICRECDEGDHVFRKADTMIQRAGDDSGKADGTRESIVAMAKSQIGKVEAKHDDGSGKRVGADRLLEYFNVAAPGVWPDSIIETAGAEMPAWCGIFSVWAHKKAGKDIGNWEMGKGVSAFGTLTVTDDPQPGDIGYIDQPYQHHCIVVSIEGDTVHSIDGNSGLFSEVIENTRSRSGTKMGFLTAFGSGGGTVQKKEEDKEEKPSGSSGSSSALEDKLSTASGGGSHLPDPVKTDMESSMGADFSNVRIHIGSSAVEMNKDLHAQAFTHGSDIYFNNGKYDPDSKSGQHLLSHELTHTIQQGAATQKEEEPEIQRDGEGTTDEEAATAVYDALDGWTSSTDSTIILKNINGKTKSSTDAIIKSVASKGNLSISGVIDWMHSDMVTSDWKALLAHLIKVEAYLVEMAIATQVSDLLSGYTSEDDSNEIYSIFSGEQPITGNLLTKSLTQLEAKNNMGRNDMAEFLFGDMTLTGAHRLSLHFFNSGSTYGLQYASYWIAYKVKDLLAGYTGINDSWAIVRNFERVPKELLSSVLYELDKLTQAAWEEPASKSLMDDMQQGDYLKLRAMMPQLPVYNPQTSLLGWAWDKLLVGYDIIEGIVEYNICGAIGIIIGALSVITDLIGLVIDLVVASKDIVGLIIYGISWGHLCRENKERVWEFFSGLAHFFGAPIESAGKMWDELTLESSLIEGPFEVCQKTIFWWRRIANFIVNLILVLWAGYGAVKLALEGIEALVALIRAGELLNAMKRIPGKLLAAIKNLPSAASTKIGKSVKSIVELITKPVKTINSVRNTVTAIRLLAQDEGYFNFIRRQAGKAIEKESKFWKERKEFWNNGAAEVDGHLADAEGKLVTAADAAVDDPATAEKMVGEAENSASNAEKKANELMEDANGTKEPEKEAPKTPTPKLSAETEAWEKSLSDETRSALEKADPETRRFWHEMDPEVRRALTYCNTPCIPLNIDPGTVMDIQKFMQRLKITDHNGLREFLHMYRDNPKKLAEAVKALDTVASVKDLETFLDNKLIETIKETHGVTIRRGKDGLWEYPISDTNVVREFETGPHNTLSGPKEKATDSFFQSHHGIQNAWAKARLGGLGYNEDEAITILLRSRNLEGGSRGTPHGLINDLQRERKLSIATRTFAEERAALVSDLNDIGVPAKIQTSYLKDVDKYFGDIYKTLQKTMSDTQLKAIFGTWVP